MSKKAVDRPAPRDLCKNTVLKILFGGSERQLISTRKDHRMRAVEGRSIAVIEPVLRDQNRSVHRNVLRIRVRELRREPVGKPFLYGSLKRMVDVRAER